MSPTYSGRELLSSEAIEDLPVYSVAVFLRNLEFNVLVQMIPADKCVTTRSQALVTFSWHVVSITGSVKRPAAEWGLNSTLSTSWPTCHLNTTPVLDVSIVCHNLIHGNVVGLSPFVSVDDVGLCPVVHTNTR